MFTVETMIVILRSSPHQFGRKFSCRSAAGCQLPVHEFRLATDPDWLSRQERTLDDDDASSRDIPFATAVSPAFAAKMNARSFDTPSPLMSPLTIGVYGVP